ncbi:MAG: YybH family protein [bacterium]
MLYSYIRTLRFISGRRTQSIFPLLLLLCFAFSCQKQGEEVAEEAKPAVETEADIAALNEIWNQYADGINTGNLDLWISLWTDDGIQIAPDAPAVVGKKQIRAKYEIIFPQFNFKMTITCKETKVAGDWTFARGTYTLSMTPKAGGETVKIDGKYLSILEKQADGTWKIARDCFNYNAPPIKEKE